MILACSVRKMFVLAAFSCLSVTMSFSLVWYGTLNKCLVGIPENTCKIQALTRILFHQLYKTLANSVWYNVVSFLLTSVICLEIIKPVITQMSSCKGLCFFLMSTGMKLHYHMPAEKPLLAVILRTNKMTSPSSAFLIKCITQ